MPIELPGPVPEEERPSPPGVTVWLSLLVVVLAVGVAWTLFTWPRNASTWNPQFWTRMLGYPAVAWCIAFGLRLHRYEEARNYWAAREQCRQDDHEEAIAFAREPLAVLGSAYACAMGTDGVAARVLKKESALQARAPRTPGPVVRHTQVELAEVERDADRLESAFRVLIHRLAPTLRSLPARVSFDVRLHLPDGADPLHLLAAWLKCWAGCGLRPAEASLVPADEGVMALDTWLDVPSGPDLERFTLFVAVQLHDKPPENSAEAAVALLLGWAPLAQRHGLKSIAMLHRPVACETVDLATSISTAALYASALPEELNHLWYSGLTKADKSAVLKEGSEVGLAAAQADDLPGMHDIDAALGAAGVAAPWLAVTLAIERACQSSEPQGIACRESGLRLAVIRPVARQDETEVT